jgi:hypothetical protein
MGIGGGVKNISIPFEIQVNWNENHISISFDIMQIRFKEFQIYWRNLQKVSLAAESIYQYMDFKKAKSLRTVSCPETFF